MNHALVSFYNGTGPDSEGRMLADMQQWHDSQLEAVHDYIQWMFPLPERSQFNRSAPLFDADTIQEFETNVTISTNLVKSFVRILDFYGFVWKMDGGIIRSTKFRQKAEKWLSPNNHNHLRITRILRCMVLCGHHDVAQMFLGELQKVYDDSGKITAKTLGFWKSAVNSTATA